MNLFFQYVYEPVGGRARFHGMPVENIAMHREVHKKAHNTAKLMLSGVYACFVIFKGICQVMPVGKSLFCLEA